MADARATITAPVEQVHAPAARRWLDAHGFDSTVGYLTAMAQLVLDETGLLPHANAGALHRDELEQQRRVSPSQGMMIESLNPDLVCHHGAPDKDPARRLAIISERTTRAKQEHQGSGVAATLGSFDHIPPMVPGVVGAAVRSFVANQPYINLVVTNVPGSPQPLYLLGAQATSVIPVVPLGPNTALGVALLSHVDTLTFGLHVDPDLCPDVDRLTGEIRAAADELLTVAQTH